MIIINFHAKKISPAHPSNWFNQPNVCIVIFQGSRMDRSQFESDRRSRVMSTSLCNLGELLGGGDIALPQVYTALIMLLCQSLH